MGLYVCLTILTHVSYVQRQIGAVVESALGDELGTKVTVERVDLGFLNRIIIDGFIVYDQEQNAMLSTKRLSARIDILPLLEGRLQVSSAQIFGLDARLSRKNEDAPLNCQFVIDSLASSDTTSSSPLDLRIASLVIRNSSLSYDQLDAPKYDTGFDAKHISVNHISSHIILYSLTDDIVDAELKNLSFDEISGLTFNRLACYANIKGLSSNAKALDIRLANFRLELPNTKLEIPSLAFTCGMNNGKADLSKLSFNGSINSDKLSIKDLQPFIKQSVENIPTLSLHTSAKGDSKSADGTFRLKALDNSLNISTNLYATNLASNLHWSASGITIEAQEGFMNALNSAIQLPEQVLALGECAVKGNADGTKETANADLAITTRNAGGATLKGHYEPTKANVKLLASDLDLGKILSSEDFGTITAETTADIALADGKPTGGKATINIDNFNFNKYSYHDIAVKANYSKAGNDLLSAEINANDPNLSAVINSKLTINSGKISHIVADANIENIIPKRLNLTDLWDDSSFRLSVNSDFSGSTIDDLTGFLNINNFEINGAHKKLIERASSNDEDRIYIPQTTRLEKFAISSAIHSDGSRSTHIDSDFLKAELNGHYKLSTIPTSFLNIVRHSISTIPGIDALKKTDNDFTLNATVKSLDFVRIMSGEDISLNGPAEIKGYLNDRNGSTNLYTTINSLTVEDVRIEDFKFLTWRPDESLSSTLSTTVHLPSGSAIDLTLNANAANDILNSNIAWKSHSESRFEGNLHTIVETYTSDNGKPCVQVSIEPSDIHVGDSIWHLRSRGITYSENDINVDHFSIGNDNQYVSVNGRATSLMSDSIIADLKNVNVEYIMNLVDFHSVEFAGFASGHVVARQLFSDAPDAKTHLEVEDFRFQDGHLGTLFVDAKLNNFDRQIDIDGVARDSVSYLGIKGFVSPQKESLDLALDARNTRLDFMESFCASFMDNVDVYGDGKLRLFGPFSEIDLLGEMVAHGGFDITTLNCHYNMPGDTILLLENDIRMEKQIIRDRRNSTAYLTGGIHHKHLGRMTYDFSIDANDFLAYDVREFGENTFYGTAYMTGNCTISGRSSELTITANGKADDGSMVVYNASSPDGIMSQDFITWHSQEDSFQKPQETSMPTQKEEDDNDVRTNIHMNFLFDITEGSTLRILMDQNTNDYIDFHGRGSLRAQYYNKGAFDLFGNYNINKGLYHMTIQNFISRDFEFLPGSIINFSGNPNAATLNLKAQYVLPSVPLSELNIGKSFSNNNIHVNCLLDITGTPDSPQVDFRLDLPTVNSDVKQMIYSLVNSEEEMKQQVVYLLAVGRFYSQGNNNADTQNGSESSLTNNAMQSILSGTISQQLANALGSALNSSKWTVGANISPGDEGFNNAEYEGIFTGSLLSNRLLINGQLGYRDNAKTTTQEFIGDFDIRYLLTPNGNIAVKVYNQANDRYFTRNSLNTQGIGLVLKTDFTNWRELFKLKKTK